MKRGLELATKFRNSRWKLSVTQNITEPSWKTNSQDIHDDSMAPKIIGSCTLQPRDRLKDWKDFMIPFSLSARYLFEEQEGALKSRCLDSIRLPLLMFQEGLGRAFWDCCAVLQRPRNHVLAGSRVVRSTKMRRKKMMNKHKYRKRLKKNRKKTKR